MDLPNLPLQDWLHSACRIEVPVKTVQGRMFVRVTAHVYNEKADFQKLADAVAGVLGL